VSKALPIFSYRQFELFLLPQMGTDHLTWISKQLQQKPHLFIDGLGRRFLPESILLIPQDRRFVDIDNKLSSKNSRYVTKRIRGKGTGSISQLVTNQILIDDIPEISNAMLANLFDIVESNLEFPCPLLLGVLRDRLRRRLGWLADQLTGKVELVPPHSASFQRGPYHFLCRSLARHPLHWAWREIEAEVGFGRGAASSRWGRESQGANWARLLSV
jgi:hypothetical protein